MSGAKSVHYVASDKTFNVVSPAPHPMLGIHFSSTQRPFPRWEIDFFMKTPDPIQCWVHDRCALWKTLFCVQRKATLDKIVCWWWKGTSCASLVIGEAQVCRHALWLMAYVQRFSEMSFPLGKIVIFSTLNGVRGIQKSHHTETMTCKQC